ncbi:MAG: ABC transporter substrate-binding protein [Spirochaeta sp.]|nr:ABC transporter substrate-binding protein [Spirochaeta sp.]RPG04613.1 MAG: ABC transporter substrate-binding protein [Proteobacteria bacterium TMED72]
MKRLAALIVSLGLVLGALGCKTSNQDPQKAASNSPVLDRIFQTGILRVGMSGDQPPFNMTTAKGQIIGMEADLANALADSMGVRAEFDKKPFGELLKALEKGEVDIVLSQVTMTTARNARVAFVGPYFISGKAILTRSKALGQADEVKDINMTGIRLSALAGSTSEAFIRQSVPTARLIATPTTDLAVAAVIDGKVDAMVADLPVCVVAVLRHPNADLITLESPFTFEPIGAALPANDPLFLNLVENYIGILEGTGAMEQLEARWLNNDAWLAELP